MRQGFIYPLIIQSLLTGLSTVSKACVSRETMSVVSGIVWFKIF